MVRHRYHIAAYRLGSCRKYSYTNCIREAILCAAELDAKVLGYGDYGISVVRDTFTQLETVVGNGYLQRLLDLERLDDITEATAETAVPRLQWRLYDAA